MNNTTKISFKELLDSQKFIEIPRIQRDYAQGREDQTEVRNRFLTAIFDALQNGKDLTLDFVYGSVEKNNFIPLDGQQRLTTLFLLYWYISNKENKFDENIKSALKKFTYSTRTSSRRFCEMLCETENKFAKKPFEEIENLPWFFKSYKKDPTIKAMLNMLDTIHERYAELEDKNVFDNLQKLQFYILPLDGFNLTEDLYIKMNARGKQLTAFENFKAEFENHIKENEFEKEEEYTKTFASKADTVWTDLFWKYKNEKNEIDASYIKFIANVAMFCCAKFDENTKESEDRIKLLFNEAEKVCPADFDTLEKFNFLKSCLDVYTQKHKQEVDIVLWNTDNNFFKESIKYKVQKENGKEVIKYSATYIQLVFLYAQTEFFRNNFSDNFEDWMRVIRNILENSTVDSSSSFIGAINLIQKISVGANDIYRWLSTNSAKSNFAQKQIDEETVKAKIIQSDLSNKSSIHEIEDINFCKGRIDFALYCIDANTDETLTNFDAAKLDKIKLVFEKYLKDNDISNDFRRAMLTIGDNDFYEYWQSWSYSLDCNKRCLIESTSDLKWSFAYGDNKYRDYLKKLVNNLADTGLITIIKDYVCPSNMPNWKQRLIKEVDENGKSLLDYHCSGHYLGIKQDNSCCYLFAWRKRPISVNDCFKVE